MEKRKRNIKERQDYRQGGRVALARGGGGRRKDTWPPREENGTPTPTPTPTSTTTTTAPEPIDTIDIPESPDAPPKPIRSHYAKGPAGQQNYEDAVAAWNAEVAGLNTPQYADRTDEQARAQREYIQQAAEGKVPADAIVPDAVKAGDVKRDAEGQPILDEEGNPIPVVADAETMQMTGFKKDPVTGESVPIEAEAATTEQYQKDASGNIVLDEDGQPVSLYKEDVTEGVSKTAPGFLEKGFSFTPPAGMDPRKGRQPAPKGMQWAYAPDGQRIPVPIGTKEGTEGQTYDAATIAYKKDAEGNVILDEQGNPVRATPQIDAAVRDLTEGMPEDAKAKGNEMVALTKEYIEQGMPPQEALAAAKAQVPDFEISDASEAKLLERLPSIVAEEVRIADATTREGQTISAEDEADILSKVTKEGTNLDDLGTYQKAAERTAQVGEAATGIAAELGTAPSEDADQRAGITGTAPQGDAAQIGGIPTVAAASMQAVTSTEERVAAAQDMLEVVGDVPPEITKALAEDPASVEAQIDSGADLQVTAAVAALPQEALVSVQMENLLGGIEEGTTPVWARPAVDAVNQMMAQRGLSVSTVGRDALFNAIIQTALPMAQSNAQALQARATQNLSNQQQANLAQSQQTMQVRMENLGNRQLAASQTAQMAQQIKVQQGTFTAEAKITTAQQQQQTRMQEMQGEQQRQAQISAQKQQAAVATFSADVQKDLADLQFLNASAKENMTAEQQTRLTKYNADVAKVMRQADLDQEMEAANLSADLQVELKNLTEMNATDRASMTEENKMRLANLGVLVDFAKTNAGMSQQMKLANMNNEQQMELAELSDKAATDTANFTADNQFRLQELTTTATVLSQNTELRTRAELAQMSASEKVALANLTAKNQADSESMNAENVAELARYDKQMNAAQFNANLAKEMGLAQLSNDQNTTLFNAQINANIDMAKFSTEEKIAMSNSKFMQSVTMQNMSEKHQGAMQNAAAMASLDLATADQRTKLAITNAQSFLAYDMSNLNNAQQSRVLEAQMAQQAMLSDQSATNAASQFNATSQQQADQFMANLSTTIELNNATRNDAMSQFNATQNNLAEAREKGITADINKFNSQLVTQTNQFNTQMDFNREQWNTANAQAVEQSNTQWRRQANLTNTAAQNAINQQNAQNAFGLSSQAMGFMWQELRDQAQFDFQWADNEATRKTQLLATAIANEGEAADKWGDNLDAVTDVIDTFFGG